MVAAKYIGLWGQISSLFFSRFSERFLTLLQSADSNCLCVVVGTKLDLVEEIPRQVTPDEGYILAKKLNSSRPTELPYFETSSVTGQNVDRVFEYIFETLLPLKEGEQKYRRKVNTAVVNLNDAPQDKKPDNQPEKSKCC